MIKESTMQVLMFVTWIMPCIGWLDEKLASVIQAFGWLATTVQICIPAPASIHSALSDKFKTLQLRVATAVKSAVQHDDAVSQRTRIVF